MKKMKILLFGSNGQLGKNLTEDINKNHTLIKCSREDLNLEELDKIQKYIESINPDLIINAAAYTKVDEAELNAELSFTINSRAVENMALAALKKNIFLIHFSTDYVFDGLKDSAYSENDEAKPLNVYGRSKLQGELKIQTLLSKFIILRVSWIISNSGTNFIKKILNLSSKNSSIKVVDDQFGSPTSTSLISKVTHEIIESINIMRPWSSGIYHLSAKGSVSWFFVAKKIMEMASKRNPNFPLGPKDIIPIKTVKYRSTAERPLNSLLCTEKIEKELNFNLPDWEEEFSALVCKILLDK